MNINSTLISVGPRSSKWEVQSRSEVGHSQGDGSHSGVQEKA